MTLIDRLWRQLETPDSAAVPSRAYIRAVIAIGHAMLGAAAVGILGGSGLWVAGALAGVYWLLKERADLQRGGSVWDGLEDAVMVGLGAWYGAWWWPALIILCAGYIMAVATWRGWGA